MRVLSRTVFRMAHQVHLVSLVFKGTGRRIAQRTVEPLAVVEDLDILKDDLTGSLPGGEALAVNKFHFQGAPEAFHGGIVITVAAATHRSDQAGLTEGLTIIATGVLDTAIGVEQQVGGRVAMQQRHRKSF